MSQTYYFHVPAHVNCTAQATFSFWQGLLLCLKFCVISGSIKGRFQWYTANILTVMLCYWSFEILIEGKSCGSYLVQKFTNDF